MKTGRPPRPALERFESKYVIDPDTLCWIWTATRLPKGYGLIGWRKNKKTVPILAHRASWEIFHGPIPVNVDVLHSCDNPPCVNPEHLFLGDQQLNMDDMVAKGRSKLGRVRLYGETNPNVKLSDIQVTDILNSTESHESLARKYKMRAEYIGRIRNGKVRAVKS